MKKIAVLLVFSGIILLFNFCRQDDKITDNLFAPTPYHLDIPAGFPPMDIPEDNKLTVEGVDLGRRLFYDPILSGDSSQSCSSCHNQLFAFADSNKRFSKGITGAVGNKNAPALFNLGWQKSGFFWDGRVATLEEQAQKPETNPIEMHDNWPNITTKLKRSSLYPALFLKAFGKKEITPEFTGKAIAQFMRTIISSNSKYKDKFSGLSASEKRGFDLFTHDPTFDFAGQVVVKGADCFHCHGAPLFQELNPTLAFRNNGLMTDSEIAGDMGYGAVSGSVEDMGKFKIPSLRNVALTAPYMHDGRFKTLGEVIHHYNSGGKHSRTIDPLMASVQFKKQGGRLKLTPQDSTDLINFLYTLTDTTFIKAKEFSNPFK